MNEYAHSFYILSSQSIKESYLKQLVKIFDEITYHYEWEQFFISTCFLHVSVKIIDNL